MDFLNNLNTQIHTWALKSIWNGLAVHVVVAILGVILTAYGVKYLPPQVVSDLSHAIAGIDVYNATPINPAP